MTRKEMIELLEGLPQMINVVQYPDYNGHLESWVVFGNLSSEDLGDCQYIIWQGDHSKALRERNKEILSWVALWEEQTLPLHALIRDYALKAECL